MRFASVLSASDAFGEDVFRFGRPIFADQQAAILIVGGDIVRMFCDELFKVNFCRADITFLHAFHGESITAKRVVRILFDELFEHLSSFATGLGGVHNWRIITAGFVSASSK